MQPCDIQMQFYTEERYVIVKYRKKIHIFTISGFTITTTWTEDPVRVVVIVS